MRRVMLLLGFLATMAACVGPTDDPSMVLDLRVLAMSFEPPELMAPSCKQDFAALAALSTPIHFRALVADPAGEGRPISYQLRACTSPSDRGCERQGVSLVLFEGTLTPGELALTVPDPSSTDPDNAPLPLRKLPGNHPRLLEQVLVEDPYKGLGGGRIPVVLDVSAGEERVVAMKLMVYSCPVVEGMAANHTPELPGVTFEDEPWALSPPRKVSGKGPFHIHADDFSDRQEAYVLPSFTLEPVALVESWKLSWHANLGRVAPPQTGGTDLSGQTETHRVEWSPPEDATEQDVTFQVVVRDGRGGESWLTRQVHYTP